MAIVGTLIRRQQQDGGPNDAPKMKASELLAQCSHATGEAKVILDATVRKMIEEGKLVNDLEI